MFCTSQPEWQNGYTHLETNLLDARVVSVFVCLGFFASYFFTSLCFVTT